MMPHEVQDHYFRQAKREGYLSRAAYKLIEIDDRKRLLRHGDWVLDCGAAPGSWLQVAAKRVGARGVIVGIDRQPITHHFEDGNIRLIEGDLQETPAEALLRIARGEMGQPRLFDVALSDMAPMTSGDRTTDHHLSVRLCHTVLDRCAEVLRPGGHLVMKVFEGEAYPELVARVRRLFETLKGFVPKASRPQSTEIYIVARKFRGPGAEQATLSHFELDQPPRRRPSRGWGDG
ncbi:MAG: RlmE family RNA methyltransferase [Planctomycetes bacterium]|nr:RlmE family RNA methyltransferase [Planctomycetota bacterium]